MQTHDGGGSNILSSGVIKGAASFTSENAPLYEDDLQVMPPHRRYASGLDRATQLRIGDCVFAVPPELIRIRTESRGQKTYPMRQPAPIITQSGYAEREIRVTLYFTTVDEINGFQTPGPGGAAYYMDGLRPFLAMIRRSPILPIRNEYLNLVCDVWAVVIAGVLIQTVDGFPGVLAVELVMRPAAMESYLMRHSAEFDEMVNWPLFRWNYQRAVADNMQWADARRRLPKLNGKYLDDKLEIEVVDVEKLGNDPWDYIPYTNYPLTEGVWIKSVSLQFQNIVTPLQTQLSEEPTYQFMGAIDTTIMLQVDCEDRTAASSLVQLHKSVMAQAREHHNRVVTSPIKVKNELLNMLGVSHCVIEAADMTTVPGVPGMTQVTLAMSAFNPAQSYSEQLRSYAPASNYQNVMSALQTINPKEINFVEQAALAELYFQDEQLYPDLDLPTYSMVKEATKKINAQRSGLGLDPIPLIELSTIEWSDSSTVDADFWMTYPGLTPGGVFDLDALQLPQDVQSLIRGDEFAATLNSARKEVSPEIEAMNGVTVVGDVDLMSIPSVTYEQLGQYLWKSLEQTPKHRTLFKVAQDDLEWIAREEGEDALPLAMTPPTEEITELPRVTRSFIAAQEKTGISAAFWVALAAHESGWGVCDTRDPKEGGKATPTWKARNFYGLTTNSLTDPMSIKSHDGKRYWKRFKDVQEGIELGAQIVFERFYVDQHRTTLGEMVVTYVGDNDGDDKREWVRVISAVIGEITGEEWAERQTPENRRKRAKAAMATAADVLYRDYQSFDIADDESHRKPRMIEDENRRLAACLHNMVRYGHRGRLSRAFPTFMLVMIDEGGMDRYARKVWANFYMYHSLINIDLIRERYNPADALHMTLTNVYGTLNWKSRHKIPIIEGFTNFFERAWDGLFFAWDNNEYLLEHRKKLLTHFDLRPGMRVHLRLGYSANPALCPVVFNGNLTEVEFGDTIEVVAQGDGRELFNQVYDIESGAPNSVDYTVSGMLIEAMTADASSWIGRFITQTTGGDLIGARTAAATSRYGLEHFGPMKLDTVFTIKKLTPMYERYKNIYPADFDGRLKKPDDGKIKEFNDKIVATMDKWQGTLGFDQQNDNEKLIWVDARGKSVWDVVKVCETVSPGYIGYPVYHGFDTRLFFGMPLWNTVYNWRMKRPRGKEEKFGYLTETKTETKLVPNIIAGGLLSSPLPIEAKVTVETDKPKDLFVELFRPFVQFHYANSLTDILGNGIRTTNDFPTVAIGVYGMGDASNKETAPQYADFTMRPDMQRTEVADLSMYQDLWLWDVLWDALGITDTRAIAIAATRNHLAKRMGEMYTGQLYLIGDPSINPHDVLHLADTYWNMAGNVTVDKVIHHMSADGGFVTVVEPKLIAFSKDELGQNNEFARMLSDFSGDIGGTVRGTIGLAAGLIALGKMRAYLEGGSALMRLGQTIGEVTNSSRVLGQASLIRLGRFTWTVGKNLFGVAIGRGQMISNLTKIKQYGEMVSKSWTVLSQWARAAAAECAAGGIASGVGGASEAMAVTAAATGNAEVLAASRLVGALPYVASFAAVTALTSLTFYWIEGILEEYVRNKETINILPLAYREGFLTAGIEGWSKLIPGYPDPKYVHVRSKAEAASLLLGTTRLPASARFQNPIQRGFDGITDKYGIPRNNKLGFHTGVDLAASEGTPIFAAAIGRVAVVAHGDSVYGNYVEIEHEYENGDRLITKYAHLLEIKVSEGGSVGPETVLGLVGETGNATGPHLHLEFKLNGVFQNPAEYISF